MIAATTLPYVMWFLVLLAVCIAVYYRQRSSSTTNASAEFKSFQRLFLVVYLTMMMADWLQGPYVYALYDQYGFSKGAIGQLFIMGFGSSMLFGTVVGGFADKYGRKANCLLFAILYSIGCITKHFNDYNILMLGRLMGGISTSILYSAFETWMIHEHKAAPYPDDWMSSTFSAMTFGSGAVAIVAGLCASALAATFGFVAPFDASLVLLCGGGFIIATRWRENYGSAGGPQAAGQPSASGWDNFGKAWRLLVASERVLLLGLIQSAFESAMYIFVFMWTPALESALRAASLADGSAASGSTPPLPHGVVFAGFMVCLMIGSKLFESIIAARPVEHAARWVFVAACAALAIPILSSNHNLILAGFCVFEVCCGIYFPAAGTMRSKYIPEEVRSTVMNVFRVGLNLIVVVVLINIDSLATDTVFLLTTLLLTLATLAQHRLFVLSEQNSTPEERSRVGLEVGEEMDALAATKADMAA